MIQASNNLTRFTTIKIEPGEVLFREGELGQCMYLLRQGNMAIQKNTDRGLVTLSVLESGDFFGEMSLLESQPRFATARAESPCVLSKIDVGDFEEMIQHEPEIAVRLLRKLSWQLRSLTEKHLKLTLATENRVEATIPGGLPNAWSTWPGGLPEYPQQAEPIAQAPKLYQIRFLNGECLSLPNNSIITLGRTDPSTGIFPDVDLGGYDPKRSLSRRHARLIRQESGLALVEELGVVNGTFVNGKKLHHNKGQLLNSGDEVGLGLVQFVFENLPD